MKKFKVSPSRKLVTAVAVVLAVAGIAGTTPGIYFDLTHHGSVTAQALPSRPVKKTTKPLITGNPVGINIPSVGINIPVINGYYYPNTKTWTLSLDKAQFATPTAKPNNLTGNTFIYGHYRVGVFYTLPRIQPGAEAQITTDNGYVFTYRFYRTYATQPTDNSVLTYQGPPMLTLQTCSGTWYQNRQMYLFSYQGYTKI